MIQVLFTYVFPIYLACMLFVSIISLIAIREVVGERKTYFEGYTRYNIDVDELSEHSMACIYAIIFAPFTIVVVFVAIVFKTFDWIIKGE